MNTKLLFLSLCLCFACSTEQRDLKNVPATTKVVPQAETEKSLCGNCQLDGLEDCDMCSYPTHWQFSVCRNTADFAVKDCTLNYSTWPQLDCSKGCGQAEADLFCKMRINNGKAVAIAGQYIVGPYKFDRGLWSKESLNKEAIELHSAKDLIGSSLFYYEKSPFDKPEVQTLTIDALTVCIIPE